MDFIQAADWIPRSNYYKQEHQFQQSLWVKVLQIMPLEYTEINETPLALNTSVIFLRFC